MTADRPASAWRSGRQRRVRRRYRDRRKHRRPVQTLPDGQGSVREIRSAYLYPPRNLQRQKRTASAAGLSVAALRQTGGASTLAHILRSAQTPAWSEGHKDGSSGLGRLKQTSLTRISMPSEIQM